MDQNQVSQLKSAVSFFLRNNEPASAVRIACQLPEPERTAQLTTILLKQVEYGQLDDARKTARLLGLELTVAQLTTILLKQVKRGRLGAARETAQLLPEPQAAA